MTPLKLLLLVLFGFSTVYLSSCVTRRTVKDSNGKTLYKETVIKRPYQSDERTMNQVFDRETELGVY